MIETTTEIFGLNAEAFDAGYKIIVNQGGTSSSKTFSIIQLLITLNLSAPMGIVSCVSESMPHLRRGMIRDFLNILGDRYEDSRYDKSNHIYSFGKKDLMEFFSADQADKLRGGRRRHLFINECNNITKDAFDELDVRTSGTTFLDFNPTADFWIHDLLKLYGITDHSKTSFPKDKNICFIHSTYLDAKSVLPKNTIEKIESRKDRDPNWWRVYGLGLVGKIEGLVYPSFTIIDRLPDIGKHCQEIFGLDFGYANDPTAFEKNLIYGDNLYSEELIYETGMTNHAIAQRFEQLGIRKNYDIIIADSAEPKSIEEIHAYGYNILPVKKGADSVEHGHQKVNQYKQHWTKNSTNCIKEQRNFMYIKDKNGNFTEKTTHFFSHGMDARRYALSSIEKEVDYITSLSKW